MRFSAATAAVRASESQQASGEGQARRWAARARELFDGIPEVTSWLPRRGFRGSAWLERLDRIETGTASGLGSSPDGFFAY